MRIVGASAYHANFLLHRNLMIVLWKNTASWQCSNVSLPLCCFAVIFLGSVIFNTSFILTPNSSANIAAILALIHDKVLTEDPTLQAMNIHL